MKRDDFSQHMRCLYGLSYDEFVEALKTGPNMHTRDQFRLWRMNFTETFFSFRDQDQEKLWKYAEEKLYESVS